VRRNLDREERHSPPVMPSGEDEHRHREVVREEVSKVGSPAVLLVGRLLVNPGYEVAEQVPG
jgi:hypothetical protein